MKTVKTIDEVKNHFKDSKEVKELVGDSIRIIQNLNTIHKDLGGYWISAKDKKTLHKKDTLLYRIESDEFAEIISYKSTKEKTPKKELKALLNLAKECLEKPNSEVCQTYKDKILDACPSLKVERDVLEVGQWYDFCFGTFFITEFTNKVEVKGYGFLNNEWEDNRNKGCFMGTKNDEDWKKADPKKVEELLIAEAKKRGYDNNTVVKCLVLEKHIKKCGNTVTQYELSDNKLFCGCQCIFKDGVWAEIIETISLSEAEKILNKKIKID